MVAMEIFLVRHGQSQANAGLTAHLDSGLTEIGKEQAKRTAKRLAAEHLTEAFTSPLRRTLETISYICKANDLIAEVTPEACEYFSHHNPGYATFPGLSSEEITAQFPFAHLGAAFPCQKPWWPDELENVDRLYARALRLRDRVLAQRAGQSQSIVIVSHADTVARLIEVFQHLPLDLTGTPWPNNCGISRLTIPSDLSKPAKLLYANDIVHLDGLVT